MNNEVKEVATEVAEKTAVAVAEKGSVKNMLAVGGVIGLGLAAVAGIAIAVKKKVIPAIRKRRDARDAERAAKAKSANTEDYDDAVDAPEDLPKI